MIMMTAYPDMETTIRAMQLGAFDYIYKPLNVNELDLIIKKALENQNIRRVVKDISERATEKYKLNNDICIWVLFSVKCS